MPSTLYPFNYTTGLTQTPLGLSAGDGILVLPDAGPSGQTITLVWPFQNPSPNPAATPPQYAFAQTIIAPVSNTSSTTLIINMPDETYSSYPLTVLVVNNSSNFLVFQDSHSTQIGNVVNPGSGATPNNVILLLTGNQYPALTGATSNWIQIPIYGTASPQPAYASAGYGLVPDSTVSTTLGSTPLLIPNTQNITAVNQLLSLSIYAGSFPPQGFTLTANTSPSGANFSVTFLCNSVSPEGTPAQQAITLTNTSLTGALNPCISISSIKVTAVTLPASPNVLQITADNIENITPSYYPLDTTQYTSAIQNDAPVIANYTDRNTIYFVPNASGNGSYSIVLPDLVTGTPIPEALATGFMIGVSNQLNLNASSIQVTAPSTATIQGVVSTTYNVLAGTTIYFVYNYGEEIGDWIVTSASYPLAPSLGGLGRSLVPTPSNNGQFLGVVGGAFGFIPTLAPSSNGWFLYWSGAGGGWVYPAYGSPQTDGFVYYDNTNGWRTGAQPTLTGQIYFWNTSTGWVLTPSTGLVNGSILQYSTTNQWIYTTTPTLTSLITSGNIGSTGGIIYTGSSVPAGSENGDIASTVDILVGPSAQAISSNSKNSQTLYTDNIAAATQANSSFPTNPLAVYFSSPLISSANISGANISSNGVIYTGTSIPSDLGPNDIFSAGNLIATAGKSLYADNIEAQNPTLNFIKINTPIYITIGTSLTFSTLANYFNATQGVNTLSALTSGGDTTSLWASNAIYSGTVILASAHISSSSRKIKTILIDEDMATQESIDHLKQTQFYKYEKKDRIRDSGTYYGVIAEELAKIVPSFVHAQNNFVPNIYEKATVEKSGSEYILTLETEIDPLSLEVYDQAGILLEDARVRLYDEKDKEYEVPLLSVSKKELIVKGKDDEDLPDLIFVYGTYESCPYVNKDALAEMGLLVLKNLLHRVETLETKLAEKESS